MKQIRYADFADRIDIDQFEEAIGFEPTDRSPRGEDTGHCLDLWGLHNNGDTTGKFSINRERRVFNCWVCGGGSLLSLAMAFLDKNDQEAVEWLYQFTSVVDQTDDDFMSEIDHLLAKRNRAEAVLPYFNENVILNWMLWHPWFEKRGISTEVHKRYRLGYNENSRRLSSKGTHEGESIIFPHYWKGRLVGWQERWLGDRPKWLPKYTNTGGFPRKETLFGYEDVYFAKGPIVVAESVPTVLFLKSIGIPSIATFGSSVSDEQIRLLRGCQQGLIFAPDNDGAGVHFLERLIDHLSAYVRTGFIEPPDTDGGDLGDLVNSKNEVISLYKSALSPRS